MFKRIFAMLPSNNNCGGMMEREEVIQIIEAARSKGQIPDLSGLDLSQTNLSMLDLSETTLTGNLDNLIGANLCGADLSKANLSNTILKENPLGGIYRPEDNPVPSPDLIMTKYNSKTKFPEGFSRYGEMEKID